MREMSVREANQNFSQVIAAAERGETIVITKNGTPVAKITPQSRNRTDDPEWRAAFAAERTDHIGRWTDLARHHKVACVAASGQESFETLVRDALRRRIG